MSFLGTIWVKLPPMRVEDDAPCVRARRIDHIDHPPNGSALRQAKFIFKEHQHRERMSYARGAEFRVLVIVHHPRTYRWT